MKDITEQKRGWKKRANPNALDKAIEWFNPEAAMRRQHARTRMALVGGYNSGDRSRPSNKKWGLSAGSSNAEILPYLDNIRSDSRDLIRNAPLARGAINTVVTNAVGTGLFPQARLDRDILKEFAGLSDEKIDQIEASIEREFKIWADNVASDAAMRLTFAAQQRLALRSTLESGDVFPVRRMIARPGRRHTTAIQLIEADRVTNPQGKTEDALLHAGVERDQFGAPMAYHVLKSHPGDRWINKARGETTRFPAFMPSGDWQVLHMMFVERPEQTRGVPYLAPVIELLKQLTRYSEAEIMSAVVASLFTVFVETEDGQGLENLGGSSEGTSATTSGEIGLGSGSIVDLAAGEKVSFADPNRPNGNFDPFVLAMLRQIGVALEIPFEILVKHFTASYSAAQAAIVEAWKFFKVIRSWMVSSFCQPCYEAVIDECVARGYIYAPGYFKNPLLRAAYLQAEWIGPPRGMIDQKKEAEANEIFEDRGWKTSQTITAELTGGDWDTNHQRRVKEKKMRDEAGFSRSENPPDSPEDFSDDEDDGDSDLENN